MRYEQTDRLHVLVADDSTLLRNAVVTLLQEEFEVVGAVSSGRDLVNAAMLLRPDVIVSDLAMPGLTGLAAMKALRDTGHSTPFVLLTVTVGDAYEWLARGVVAVVDKSDLRLELVAAVNAAAAGRIYLSRNAITRNTIT